MVQALYVITLLSSCAGALVFVVGFTGAQSAPQEAAAAAAAVALAVVPYVFTRCVQLANDYSHRRANDSKLVELLQESNELARKRAQTTN